MKDKIIEILKKYQTRDSIFGDKKFIWADDFDSIASDLSALKDMEGEEVSDEIECTWINEKVRCAFYKKKCHICTKNGATTEIGNHFAPYRKPIETI